MSRYQIRPEQLEQARLLNLELLENEWFVVRASVSTEHPNCKVFLHGTKSLVEAQQVLMWAVDQPKDDLKDLRQRDGRFLDYPLKYVRATITVEYNDGKGLGDGINVTRSKLLKRW